MKARGRGTSACRVPHRSRSTARIDRKVNDSGLVPILIGLVRAEEPGDMGGGNADLFWLQSLGPQSRGPRSISVRSRAASEDGLPVAAGRWSPEGWRASMPERCAHRCWDHRPAHGCPAVIVLSAFPAWRAALLRSTQVR